jgi:hypothetical protein
VHLLVVTVKVPALDAVPPGAVTAILPVGPPAGTAAFTNLSVLTINLVAATPPNVTFVAPVKPVPFIDTFVPIGPLLGVKLVITGGVLKIWLFPRPAASEIANASTKQADVNFPIGLVAALPPLVKAQDAVEGSKDSC